MKNRRTRPIGLALITGMVLIAASTPASGENKFSPLEVANFGNGFLGMMSLANIIADQINVNRSATIWLQNDSKHLLANPKTYFVSGGSVSLPREVRSGGKSVFAVKKSDGAAAGAVGVITYDIVDSNFRLAILYSVPYDYNLYENWFKFQIISNNTPTDKALYEDMYYNYGKKTLGPAAAAKNGYAKWVNGFVMQGTMGTTGNCNLKLRFSEMP